MKRRTFLELLVAGSVAGRPLRAQEVVPPLPQRALVTISGITARSDSAALGAVLAQLVVGGVPVNLVVDPGTGSEGLRPESAIGRLLQRYSASFPGLIEIVVWCPGLGAAAPFQGARLAHRARRAVSDALQPGPGAGVTAASLGTIACAVPLDARAASAALSAGFRCVLALPGSPPDVRPSPASSVVARLDRQGLLSLVGGEITRIEDAAALLSLPVTGLQRHLILSADEISATPLDRIVPGAQDLARVLREAALDLKMISVLAGDVQMRTDLGFRRRIAVHLLQPGEGAPAAEADASRALQQLLGTERIPFSLGPQPEPGADGADPVLAYWVPLDVPSDPGFDPDLPFGTFEDASLPPAVPGVLDDRETRFGIVVRPVRDAGSAGLTEAAVQNVPILAVVGVGEPEASLHDLDLIAPCDGVVLVLASAFRTPALRSALVQVIRRSLMQPFTRLVTLPVFCAETLPKDPLLPALLLVRSRGLRRRAAAETPPDEDHAALLDDARVAWSYFSQYTYRATGLSPATALISGRPGPVHRAVTMWEAGSHLNALIAAVDLGLISDDEFAARVARLISTVERATSRRRSLPPETIDGESGRGTSRFNSYDSARLLIALSRLRAHRLAPGGLEDLVAGWKFGQAIINRRFHSFRDGGWVDDYASNYADYAAAGLRLWGFDVASPADRLTGVATADVQAELLSMTVSFGLLGAEPAFLHLLEMPTSPVAEYLADCLDAIQFRLAEQSGLPGAPSESPLDRSPWFTYQGFDLRNLADPWMVQFGARGLDPATEAQVQDLRATSTKAGYLWHALRPNRHSARLVGMLREKTRGAFGFASALYQTTLKPTEGYTDLNTNAVILQSVAHILRPGK